MSQYHLSSSDAAIVAEDAGDGLVFGGWWSVVLPSSVFAVTSFVALDLVASFAFVLAVLRLLPFSEVTGFAVLLSTAGVGAEGLTRVDLLGASVWRQATDWKCLWKARVGSDEVVGTTGTADYVGPDLRAGRLCSQSGTVQTELPSSHRHLGVCDLFMDCDRHATC
ncbi:uncharacterized protein B0I36DRAFT_349859 [Microdochium trichocladiopsis]|uniref:Uncharacterized protein n=1 Tax=Microdochium trichocladiopsis TaxID=1682393 RepID=A0A9P8Y4G1_9PEZI|nr:uncharacterized protein B0I36DRAFT_349859 [Microdochium trichocladiopsis]KAH7028875.1 hypothetical protein B0I36DRAFT_349859 [Microdochium trichocladiopsis]